MCHHALCVMWCVQFIKMTMPSNAHHNFMYLIQISNDVNKQFAAEMPPADVAPAANHNTNESAAKHEVRQDTPTRYPYHGSGKEQQQKQSDGVSKQGIRKNIKDK